MYINKTMPKVKKVKRVQQTQLNFYDFTLHHDNVNDRKYRMSFIKALKPWCKKFVFQLEQGDGGKLHYQGRLSLITKRQYNRIKTLWKDDNILRVAHLSPTSNEGKKTFSYVMKADTRIDGPWDDTDVPVTIFKQHEIKELYPWQQSIKENCEQFEKRKINLLIDPTGCLGKSTLIANLITDKKIYEIFPMADPKDLMRMVMNTLGEEKYPKAVFIDIPRSADRKLAPLFNACELIKEGKCYDDRYTFRVHRFQSPTVWITMNWEPKNMQYLSLDRWKIWKVVENALVLQE